MLSNINDQALFPLVRIIGYLLFSVGNIGAKTTGKYLLIVLTQL